MYYVSENDVRKHVTQADVTEVVRQAYQSLADGDAICFPLVRESLNYADAIFGFKSGFDKKAPALGVKAGGLWPGNSARGVANHQSTVLLFDRDSGEPHALVRATYLTALRTAAASALSIRYLARKDASVLGVVGAGGQGEHQITAALCERNFQNALIFDRNPDNAKKLAAFAQEKGLKSETVDPETLAKSADVIITITPSQTPVLDADWIRPGTHLACMGADTVGKQEVDEALFRKATVFGDIAEQMVAIGECQHAFKMGFITQDDITTLGAVINGSHPGRRDDDEITLFDSTGVALQDLASALLAVNKRLLVGTIIELE